MTTVGGRSSKGTMMVSLTSGSRYERFCWVA